MISEWKVTEAAVDIRPHSKNTTAEPSGGRRKVRGFSSSLVPKDKKAGHIKSANFKTPSEEGGINGERKIGSHDGRKCW